MSDRVLRASEWCYRGIWRIVTEWLRVPEQPPTLPVLPGEHVDSFRPSPGYLRYLKFFFWLGLLIVDIFLTIGWIVLTIFLPWVGILITPIALAIIVLPDVVAYIAIHLRYDTTWYVLTDRSMRIRRGIWNIHETTITFENIQNIHLSQGPFQRHYGIADLVVQTAGGGSATGPHGEQLNTGAHIGILEGLDHAEQVRDLIMQRLKSLKTTGLGDERSADHKEGTGGFSEVDLQLLREIHQITARLSHSQS